MFLPTLFMNKMSEYTCKNKRCSHVFHSEEQTNIIKCPVCNFEHLNIEKVLTSENWLFIEKMFENINQFGEKETFNMIDKNYSNAITRAKVRNIYFETLKIIENEN